MVGGSNPLTPTINSYLNPPKSANKNINKTVNNDGSSTRFLKELSTRQAQLGLSDRSLAKRLGISNAYLSYIKRGHREVTPTLIQRASEANPMRKLCQPKVSKKIVQDIPLDLIREALKHYLTFRGSNMTEKRYVQEAIATYVHFNQRTDRLDTVIFI